MSIEGYDTSLHALREHFSSCGKIKHIYVPRDFESGILKRVAFMRIEGEGAEEKALELSGTDVGGWTAIVKAAPWQKETMDPWCAAAAERKTKEHSLNVTGYVTWLPVIDIEMAVCKYLSSCGEVTRVVVLPSCARISII
ncbi:RNA-binding domain superfamily [Arabidopsis thaliana x Arabidopsis arenosa]|uniref:RNA-binding domain superfamily n=1 Tax=Arabidopsis thaliana x Arabidopsis arenosa TaxID=1240361 RepID=A0A8T1ZN39_9BRAS|nr:RNA-binding domain superfamily [Arabidopsis thaliana x Arabidopsis arenosa]